MSLMFSQLKNLQNGTINLSNLDTSSATNMEEMFSVSTSLTTLDLSNFNTSNVENMAIMFASASKYSYN